MVFLGFISIHIFLQFPANGWFIHAVPNLGKN
jgi:hypothetical protein